MNKKYLKRQQPKKKSRKPKEIKNKIKQKSKRKDKKKKNQRKKEKKKKHCRGAFTWFELCAGGFLVQIFCEGFLFNFILNSRRKHFSEPKEKIPKPHQFHHPLLPNQILIKSIISPLFFFPFFIHPKIFPIKTNPKL